MKTKSAHKCQVIRLLNEEETCSVFLKGKRNEQSFSIQQIFKSLSTWFVPATDYPGSPGASYSVGKKD